MDEPLTPSREHPLTCRVPPHLAACCHTGHSRYAVDHILRISGSGEAFYTATDGRLAVYVDNGDGEPADYARPLFIPPEAIGNPQRSTSLVFDGECWKDRDAGRYANAVGPDERFVPVDEVLPDADEYMKAGGRIVGLNADLLAKIFHAISPPELGGMTLIIPAEKGKPILCVGRRGAIGVLMPTDFGEDPVERYRETRQRFLDLYRSQQPPGPAT